MRKSRAKTTRGILRAAARVIQKQGWFQGGFAAYDPITETFAPSGPVCALGAINLALAGKPDADEAFGSDAAHALEAAIGGAYIPFWNDAPGRTVDEILAAFAQAAALA